MSERALIADRDLPKPADANIRSALRHRYDVRVGNGPRYVIAEEVRSHASFDARRMMDFAALDTWKSGRFSFHGHEIKASRSDWLRERKHPEKAAEFTPFMHYWWLVVGFPAIVQAGELPDGWGLMVLSGASVKVIKQATRREAEPMGASRLTAFIRAVATTPQPGSQW